MLHTLSLMALDITTLATITLFVAVGVWSLYTRFQRQEEWSLRVQIIVLMAVGLFYLVEATMLRIVLRDNVIHFIFALLGLLVAGLALYGHILVSVVSRLLVELLIPDNPANAATPRLGPAEALERQQDWEGALNEYYVLARIYPDNPLLYIRVANNLIRLNRDAEAVAWFERAITCMDLPENNLAVVRRLCDTLESLDQPEKAHEALRAFAERFAGHEAGKAISEMLKGADNTPGNNKPGAAESDELTALKDAPIQRKREE